MTQERIGNSIEVSDDENTVPAKAQTPQQTKAAPAEAAPQKGAETEEKGTDWVEIDDPKLKARFNRLYRHTKEANERAEKTERQIALLAEQNRKLQQAIESIYGNVRDKQTQDEMAALKKEAKEAFATGDADAFVKVNERLVDLKQDLKKAAEQAPPPQQQQSITDTEMQVLRSWQSAQDEDGAASRPWAQPNHPEFATTQDMIARVTNQPDMQNASIREILREVDRRMSALMEDDADIDEEQPNPVRRAFSTPRGRPVPKQQETSLSAQERVIAEMMFTGGRGALAKNAKEAYELFRKQKAAIGRSVVVED